MRSPLIPSQLPLPMRDQLGKDEPGKCLAADPPHGRDIAHAPEPEPEPDRER